MIEKMILDADICVKLGGSEKYRFLYDILPLIAKQIYMHTHVYEEVLIPSSAVSQLRSLIDEKVIVLVNENGLQTMDRAVYDAAFTKLARVMIDPRRPNKNRGETSSLAYAKAAGIPVFATDEMNLQPIIDVQLNTGMDDINCLRIIDVVQMAHDGKIDISRKTCKALWVIAGKEKALFDTEMWPIKTGEED